MQINLSKIAFSTVLILLWVLGCSNTDLSKNISEEKKLEAEHAEKKQINEDHASPQLISVQIVKVVDGDTMVIRLNGQEERIRLLLVDTPESVHPTKPVEPFGLEASQFTKDRLPSGKQVELELDVSERDKYGRLLCYLWVEGKMFNAMLLEEGLARVAYVFPPNIKYVEQFREIEKLAKQMGIGIWSIEDYAREDGFFPEAAKKNNPIPFSDDGPGPNGEWIKGNINRQGEKIYHKPGGQFYDQTNPEEWFFNEEEAQGTGFRPSKR